MASPLKIHGRWAWLAMLVVAHAGLAAPQDGRGGIVKWVDEKGITHYGDAVPPEYADRSNTLLNKSGRVLRKNEAFKPTAQQPVDADQEKQLVEQQRRDGVLMASYTTEDEIDLARDRSTQMDEAAIKGLEQRAAGVRERLVMHQKSAAAYASRKAAVPGDIRQDIDDAKGELGRIDAQIAQKRKDIEATRVHFDRDKQRFHELKQMAGGRKSPPAN